MSGNMKLILKFIFSQVSKANEWDTVHSILYSCSTWEINFIFLSIHVLFCFLCRAVNTNVFHDNAFFHYYILYCTLHLYNIHFICIFIEWLESKYQVSSYIICYRCISKKYYQTNYINLFNPVTHSTTTTTKSKQ